MFSQKCNEPAPLVLVQIRFVLHSPRQLLSILRQWFNLRITPTRGLRYAMDT